MNRRVVLFLVGLILAFAGTVPRGSSATQEGTAVPVGVAKVDITPEQPVRMYG